MSFTEKVRGTYGFHEQTLSDRTLLVENTTTRTLVQNEIVVVGGVFGNVLEHKGIAGGASGLININNDRTIKTEQLANGAAFEVGGTVYAVAGTDTDPVGLTNTQGTNTPVGRVVEIDPAATQKYVVFRPFIQPAPASGSASDVADLKDAVAEIQANEVKTVALVVDKDAKTAPITFANATTGLGVGDVIIGVCAQCTTANAGGTMKVTHGGAGAAITDEMVAAVKDVVTQAPDTITGCVVTADGLDVVSHDAADRAIVYVTYIKA